MKYLLLPVEIYTRSFKSRLRIAHAFASLGGSAVIGPHHTMKKVLSGLSTPAGYLSKGESTTEANVKLIRNYSEKGMKLFLLDEEGGVLDSKGEMLAFRYNYKVSKYFHRVYLWGENQKHLLKEMIPQLNTAIVTGNPRFDLLQYTLQASPPKNNITDFIARYKKTLLINTSFPAGNNIREDKELIAFQKNLLGPQFKEREFEMHIAHHRLAYLYFKRLIESIINDFGDQFGIIIRPHPAENPAAYEEYENRNSNVIIDRERLITAGVLSRGCTLTIHYDCTTGIEALLSGSKVVAYVPFTTEYSQQLPLKSTLNLQCYSDIKELLFAILADKDDEEIYHVEGVREVEGFIENFRKNQNTATIIAEDIYKHSAEGNENDLKIVLNELHETKMKRSGKQYLRHVMRRFVKPFSKNIASEYKKNKMGSVDVNEVQEYFNSLNQHSGKDITLSRFANDVFLLENNNS